MTQIAFTGDLAFSKHFSGKFTDEKLLSDEIVEFLSTSDYTVVNVEGAVSTEKASAEKPLLHANPVECVDWIKRINGNIWNLANNHTTDCGESGVISTLDAAREMGAAPLGLGLNEEDAKKPVIINSSGGIGIVSVTYSRYAAKGDNFGCFSCDDEEEIKRVIAKIKAKNRWCIMVSHEGHEFSQIPMPYLRNKYHRFLEYGADIVVGHHPHVVQNYEKVGDKIIFYSLGNFIFDTDYQRLQNYTENGILLKLKFDENSYSWEHLPTLIDREENRVKIGETPDIFTNVSSTQYNLLWPLSGWDLCRNEKKKHAYTKPKLRDYSWLDWLFKWELKRMNQPQGKYLMIGRFLSIFQIWRFGDKKLKKYIIAKKEK